MSTIDLIIAHEIAELKRRREQHAEQQETNR